MLSIALFAVLCFNIFPIPVSEANAANPKALYISKTEDMRSDILRETGFDVDINVEIPADLSQYQLVVASDINAPLGPGSDVIRKYVRDGGGYVFISGVAYWSDLENNGYWLGAYSVGYTGPGESAFVSSDNPLETDLIAGDLLKQQAESERGAQLVYTLEPGAVIVAEYSGGGIYAYTYNYGAGRVFYQADTNPSLAGDVATNNIKELFSAGIKWAAKLENIALLPAGTVVSNNNVIVPDENNVLLFAKEGPQSVSFPEPSGKVTAIVAMVTTYVEGAVLHFNVDGKQYSHSIFPNTNTMISFDKPVTVSEVVISYESRGYPDDQGHVGYFYAPEDPFRLGWIAVAVAAAGGSVAAFFVMRNRAHPLPSSDRSDVIQKENEEKSAILKELEGELGSALKPASSMSELIGRFSHGKQEDTR